MSCNIFLFKKKIVPKTYFLKFLNGALFLWTLWIFLLGLLNQKMTLATLNISFHIDLRKFVGD
jgi:hypothetical protein